MSKLRIDESQNIEYKEAWNDKYLEWICGFANAQGGTIYIGVNDDHEIVGVSRSKQLMEDIPNKIVTHLGIVADVNLHTVDGLDYIDVIVEPNSVPISYRGHYHYRSGSTKQELKGVALQEFLLKKMNLSWDNTPCTSATLEAIDPEAVSFFVKRATRYGRIPESCKEDSVEQILRRLHLINDNNDLVIAALLLFGRDIEKWCPTAIFRIGRFGMDEAHLIGSHDIKCPLIKMPSEIMQILRTFYLVAPIHFEGMQRIEVLEVPEEALREMLCNAIIHRDYQSTYIQMKVWDDHMTLWNPGTLPLGYTIDTLMHEHESHPRNKLIANVFYLAGYVEAWGRGYTKISNEFKNANLKEPIFEEVRGGMRATILREKFLEINRNTIIHIPHENTQPESISSEEITQVITQVTTQVKVLILCINSESMTKGEILKLHKFKHKSNKTLQEQYFTPAMSLGLLTMEYPDTPHHPRQKYKLTEKGLMVLKQLKEK